MPGVARVVGSAIAQVGIKLTLDKAAFNKDVQQTTKKAESSFSKSFNKIEKTLNGTFSGKEIVSYSKQIDYLQTKLNKLRSAIATGNVPKGSSLLQMEAEAEQLQNQIINLKKHSGEAGTDFSKLSSATKTAFSKMGNIVSNGLSKVRDNFAQTFNRISNIMKVALVAGSAYMVKFSKDAIQAASDTQAAWTGLNSIVVGTGGSFGKAQTFLNDYVKDGLIPLTNAVTAYKNLAARGYSTEQIEQTLTALKDAAAFGRQSSYSYGDAITSATEGLKNENSILVDNAGVTKNVAKMWDEYAASIGTTANNLTQQQKIQAEVNGILEETKFQTGDATRYADTYAGKLAKVSTAFYNLKVTVGQVITPIVELFLPVIERALNALTRLFNKLKSIMAVFGLEMKEYIGKDSTSAISNATDSASALGDSLDGSGEAAKKAAKKIKKAFANVDEINVLNMGNNSSNGSSGTGGSGVGGGSSETGGSIIEDGLEEQQDKITQNLDWLKRSAFDWGVAFGEAINRGLEKIPWEAIQSTVNGAVEKVAEFLNGAVAGLDWHLLGTTFGNGFNTIIYGLNTFYKTFNWDALGVGLGEGVNGIIDSVDWSTTGEFFARKFSSIFQVLSNTFDTIDWKQLGHSLGNGVQGFIDYVDFDAIADTFTNGFNGVFTSISNFFIAVDWGDLGKKLIGGLNRAISNLDFNTVGEALENGLKGAIDFMWGAITKFDAKTTGKQIADLINSIVKAIENTDWKKLGKTFTEGFNKCFEMLHTFFKETDWGKLVGSLIKGIMDFILNIDWLGMFKDMNTIMKDVGVALIEGIWGGIKGALKSVGEKLKEILIDPIVNAVKDLFGIHSPSTVFAEIGGYLIEGLWSGISRAKDWIVEKWNKVKDWFSNIVKTVSVAVSDLTQKVKDKWNSVKNWFKGKTENISAGVSSLKQKTKDSWNKVKGWFKGKTENISAGVTSLSQKVKDKWNKVKGWFKGKTETISAKVGSYTTKLKNNWSGLLSKFKGKEVEIKAKVGGVVGNFKSTINDKLIKPLNKKLPSIFPKIPYLAQGSWFKKNSPTLAVVGDNKREPEIVTPESKIKDQVTKGIQEAGATTNKQHFDFTIKLEYPDGKYLIKEINDTQIKDGKISLLI